MSRQRIKDRKINSFFATRLSIGAGVTSGPLLSLSPSVLLVG